MIPLHLCPLEAFGWTFWVFDTYLECLTFQGIDLNKLTSLFQDIVRIFSKKIFFYQIFIVFDKLQQSPAPILYKLISTFYLILFFVVYVHILLEPLLSFFSFRVIFLEILAKVNQMDLNFQISFADIVFFRFEILLMSE